MTGSLASKVVIIGASRGIGLELAKQYHQRYPGPDDVVATMRKPNKDLLPSGIRIEALDVTEEESVQSFASLFASIDILIINAVVGQANDLRETSKDLLRWYMETNVIGIHHVLQLLTPALTTTTTRDDQIKKKLVYISSSDASMQRQIGGKIGLHGPYVSTIDVFSASNTKTFLPRQSISKAAGQMMAIQYYNVLQPHRVALGLIHPGWVATDLGKTAGEGGMPVERSVNGVVEVIENKLRFDDGPQFLDWSGQTVPW